VAAADPADDSASDIEVVPRAYEAAASDDAPIQDGELRRVVHDHGVVLIATHRGEGVRPSA
jgi:hypothetical protein